jgi:sugar/nucleoside kinase (ribokinase family)
VKTYDVYGIGAALVDVEYKVEDSFLQENQVVKGLMTLVDENRQYELIANLDLHSQLVKRSCGGSACNTVVVTSGFGATAFYAGKVASDDAGAFFIKDLNDAGVDFHEAGHASGITGKCLVMISDDAERTMNTYLGVNVDLSSADVDTQLLVNSKWLYIEGYLVTDSQRTEVAVEAMSFAKQHNVKTALSLSDPFVVQIFSQQLKSVIGDTVDLLFCNEEEAINFTGSNTIEQAGEALKDYANSFVITRGAAGSMVYDGEQTTYTLGVKAKAINTNGAGDMFAGAFLYAISAGHDYVLAAQFANAAAALVVSRFGPRIETSEYDKLKQQFAI